MINASNEYSKPVDSLLLMLYLMLVVFGIMTAYAVSYSTEGAFLFDFGTQHGKQLLWGIIGASLGGLLLLVDYKFFTTFSSVIFILMCILLVFTFLFAPEFKGSKSWFEVGPIKIQPSEFAKFATCLVLARFASSPGQNFQTPKTQFLALGIIGIPLVLILMQGDVGTAMVFTGFIFLLNRMGMNFFLPIVGILGSILFIATLNWSWEYVLGGAGVIALIPLIMWVRQFKVHKWKIFILFGVLGFIYAFSAHLVPFVFDNVLKEHHRNRIYVMLGKEVSEGADYNVLQSKIAISSGGFFGKGYLQGSLTKGQFVPEQSTDFIFSTIGEEFGFLGSAIFIALYASFIIRIFILAERQRSMFSKVYAYGCGIVIFMHFMLNISMTVGLFPVVGIPLPFISYGGSSLLGFSIMIFILLKLDKNRTMAFR